MIDLTGKIVGVTGAKGFIGRRVCESLKKRGCVVFDFEDKRILQNVSATYQYLKNNGIEYVMHLAGYNGGIEFNRLYPADVFTLNTILALNIVAASCHAKVKKLLGVITSCAYPEHSPRIADSMTYSEARHLITDEEPHKEEWLFNGPPNKDVACHGYAKRNLAIAAEMYRKQHGFNSIIACPNTVYGPGDRTDPQRTKVMTSLIKKFVDAKRTNAAEVVCWGTGKPKREFIYVDDTAELLVRTLERYEGTLPLNLSTGQEYTIKALSELIAQKVGYTGKIVWDTTKGDGAMRKALNLTRMQECLGDFEFTPIDVGIERTIKWYEETQ